MVGRPSIPAPAEHPPDEAARVASLRDLQILDTPPEERFDRITHLAARVFDAPIALVSLIDSDRQWFKSCVGLGTSETGREISFCSHAILSAQPMIIPDALTDARFAGNPLVTGPPKIRSYAGVPLADTAGRRLGTLCVIDTRPRTFAAAEIEILRILAGWAEREVNSIGLERTTHLLRQSEALYRSVISAVEEGIVVHDQTGAMAACNASAERILGVPAERIVGRSSSNPPWRTVDADGAPLPDDDHPAAITLRTGQPCSGVIMGIERPEAEIIWLAVNARALVRQGESQPFAAVTSFADVTERRAVEQKKDEFVSVVSHELRTPLASVRGALSLIASSAAGELPTAARRMLEIAVANTDRLSRLIDDILDVERMRSGRMSLSRQEIDAAAVLGHVVEMMQQLAVRSGVTLHAASCDVRAWGDPDRIEQTLTNLVGNSIKFTPPGGTVRLSASDEGDHTAFRVADEGRGIPEGELEAVFERFHQVETPDARTTSGTGLGLAICRGIIEQHGGRIWVDSVVGRGSTFTFTIPAMDGTRSAARDPRAAEAPVGASAPVSPVPIGETAPR